jgi:hypothetical protein
VEFEQQHALAGRREAVGEGAPAGAGADDDDAVVRIVGHGGLLEGLIDAATVL